MLVPFGTDSVKFTCSVAVAKVLNRTIGIRIDFNIVNEI